MDRLVVFVIMALSFNAVFMIQAYAQNITAPETENENENEVVVIEAYTGFFVAIGTMVGTIGSILGVVAVFIKNKNTRDLAQQVGWGMSIFGQKSVENVDRIRSLVKAAYELGPEEGRNFLQERRVDAQHLTESIMKGNAQLDYIMNNLPGNTTKKINIWKEKLPTESFETKPGL
jgi:hypothetical protein